ncbi:MAG: arginase [Methylocystaceae bacterium]|nr:arginase [Methylocystaceae bacterium]
MIKPIKIVEIKSEIGAGTRGASMGVDAIKIAALDFGSPFFKRFKSVEIPHENNLLLEPIIHDYAKRIKGIYSLNDRLSKEIAKIIKSDQVPIVLAGDHSSALGTISGIKMAHPEKRLGVIWIDAHADLHSPYTTPSGNMHGMPLCCVLGEDNRERQQNKPDDETLDEMGCETAFDLLGLYQGVSLDRKSVTDTPRDVDGLRLVEQGESQRAAEAGEDGRLHIGLESSEQGADRRTLRVSKEVDLGGIEGDCLTRGRSGCVDRGVLCEVGKKV